MIYLSKFNVLAKKSKDTAEGQMAGYLFQPDRALFYLSQLSDRNNSVSVELIDDVTIHEKEGSVILTEQDKHTISQSSSTFSDNSKDLWRTLQIWIEKIKTNVLSLDSEFICCSNKKLPTSYILSKISKCKTEEQAELIITELKKIELAKKEDLELKDKKPASSVSLLKIMTFVISDEAVLKKLIIKIKIQDEQDLESMNDQILNNINLTKNHIYQDKILLYLKGWISEKCKLLINSKSPILISKEDFNSIVQSAYDSYNLSSISFTARKQFLEEIGEEEIETIRNNTFVEQLSLIKHRNIKNIILDAIRDYLCYEKEIINVAKYANITSKDFDDFAELNRMRWQRIFDRHIVKEIEDYTQEEKDDFAYKIYDEVLSIEVKFKDMYEIPISSSYFKNGNYHSLAENLQIGWHPNWKKIFKLHEKAS